MSRGTIERQARRWDELVRTDVSPGQSPLEEVATSVSVLRAPADEHVLREAETRLGVSLPPSYRAFLSVSDGAYADPEGVITAGSVSLTRSRPPGLGLLPVEQVEHLVTADPDLFQVWAEQVGSPGGPIQHDGEEVSDFDALRRGSLLIGSAHQGATALVRATRAAEWQLWIFQKETVIGYKSFGSWLRTMAYSLTASALPDALARYAAGDERFGDRIVRVRDPRAVPILLDALQAGFKQRRLIINALGSIGTPEAALALEPFLIAWAEAQRLGEMSGDTHHEGGHAQYVLGTIKGQVAADILARHGCHHQLAERRDPRAGPLAVQALTPPAFMGANSLRLLGDPQYLPDLRDAAARAKNKEARAAIAIARYDLGDRTVISELREIARDDQNTLRPSAEARLTREPR